MEIYTRTFDGGGVFVMQQGEKHHQALTNHILNITFTHILHTHEHTHHTYITHTLTHKYAHTQNEVSEKCYLF